MRKFISLLHVAADQQHANLRSGDALTVYALSAVLLAKTLRRAGYDFALVTNQPGAIAAAFETQQIPGCAVIPHTFSLDVPQGIQFYSAHFKLELFGAIADGAFGDAVGIIDVDGVQLRPFRSPDEPPALSVYDIGAQEFPDYQQDRIRADLEAVAGTSLADARWYGGEYIFGSCDQFATLADYVARCWPRYRSILGTTHHVGDEMVTSAALNLMRLDGVPLADEGARGEVTRWWSARTLLPQMPLRKAKETAYLHLPADKEFLAGRARLDFAPETFLDAYQRRTGVRIAVRTVQNLIDRTRGVRDKFVPAL